MKTLRAEQCNDGWYVVITETRFAPTLRDVKSIARHEGLQCDHTAMNEVFIAPSLKEDPKCTCDPHAVGKVKKNNQKKNCSICSQEDER